MLIRSIYTYLISAVTLIMMIVGSVTLVSNALSLTVFTGYVESYDDFVRNRCNGYGYPMAAMPVEPISKPTTAGGTCDVQEALISPEWQKRYENYAIETKESDKRFKLDRMIKAIPLILVPLPVFLMFQKKRQER